MTGISLGNCQGKSAHRFATIWPVTFDWLGHGAGHDAIVDRASANASNAPMGGAGIFGTKIGVTQITGVLMSAGYFLQSHLVSAGAR